MFMTKTHNGYEFIVNNGARSNSGRFYQVNVEETYLVEKSAKTVFLDSKLCTSGPLNTVDVQQFHCCSV